MAEEDNEKTEDPSQKRQDEALERGDVVSSQEVSTWFLLGGALLALSMLGGPAASSLRTTLGGFLGNAHLFRADGPALASLSGKLGLEVLATVAIPLLLLLLAAAAGGLVQHRPVWTAHSLKPKFERVSPGAGFKRIFSKHAVIAFVKGCLKIALVGTILLLILWPERTRLEGLTGTAASALLPLTEALALKLLTAAAAVLAIVAAADYLLQYRMWFSRQKMTLHEVREEFKQSEGDPKIKGKLREIRQSRMRKRMMTAVPQASVVIANPTHFAVALRYEAGMNAPVCLAKGVDALALKIREVAAEHGVPVVENPPLARALHAAAQIDAEIPPEHYKAVAEVIGYIMRLRGAARGR